MRTQGNKGQHTTVSTTVYRHVDLFFLEPRNYITLKFPLKAVQGRDGFLPLGVYIIEHLLMISHIDLPARLYYTPGRGKIVPRK